MMSPSTDQILALFARKRYLFFNKPHKLNIVGVRSNNSVSDNFDDELHVLYRDRIDGPINHLVFPCTTDPGKHWLLNPLNARGCAIMVPNQYRDVYEIGLHKGEYPALVQRAPIQFVRDNNRDNKLDFSLYRDFDKRRLNLINDVIGANIHRASQFKKALNVGMYSAACQVIQDETNHQTLMVLANNQVATGGGKRFTYTLTEEQDYV